MRRRLDFSMSSIEDKGRVSRSDGSHTQRAILRAAEVCHGDQVFGMTAVAEVTETYLATCPEDHSRARLQLYRAAAARLRELAFQAQRDAD